MSAPESAEQRKQRTITLTDRPPVRIYEDECSAFASADFRHARGDGGRPGRSAVRAIGLCRVRSSLARG